MHTSTDLPPPSDRDAGTVAGTYASADSDGNAGGAATATMTRPYAADDGLFDDHSMIRRVHRERIVALHGPRTLLMQASHPLAFVGFWGATAWRSASVPVKRCNVAASRAYMPISARR